MSAILSMLLTALMRVAVSVVTAPVAEAVMRRVLIHALEWIVASTRNTVDDDLARPIIDELRGNAVIESLGRE